MKRSTTSQRNISTTWGGGLALWALISAVAGCGTTQHRLATDQLVISDAVDAAIAQMDFRVLAGQKVFLDTSYVRMLRTDSFVNSEYVISSLRQHLMAAHCQLQESADQADIIVEPRVGTMANNRHEVVYGIPQSNGLSAATNAVAGAPLLPPLPELSVARNDMTIGISKVAVFAYDRVTKEPVWQSGISRAESNAKNSWVLGIGPFQRGSIYQNGYRFAGEDLQKRKSHDDSNPPVPYAGEHVFQPRREWNSTATQVLSDETPRALR